MPMSMFCINMFHLWGWFSSYTCNYITYISYRLFQKMFHFHLQNYFFQSWTTLQGILWMLLSLFLKLAFCLPNTPHPPIWTHTYISVWISLLLQVLRFFVDIISSTSVLSTSVASNSVSSRESRSKAEFELSLLSYLMQRTWPWRLDTVTVSLVRVSPRYFIFYLSSSFSLELV